MQQISEQGFQSTRPLRGGTLAQAGISGEDAFQSTRPLRGGTPYLCEAVMSCRFQSTRPLRGGTTMTHKSETQEGFQSTRPLRGGTGPPTGVHGAGEFQSTRPLRGGTRIRRTRADADEFQSTRPLRGGTFVGSPSPATATYFNPPAPCGAGPASTATAGRSIKPLRANQRKFQSTRPLRGGTGAYRHCIFGNDFNPPAPCGAGLSPIPFLCLAPPFQSTRPLRGGTAILHKKTVQNIAYCTKSAFTLAVLSGFLALMRPFFCQTCTNFGANLPKNRCSLPVRTLIPSGPPPADSRH